MLSEPCEYIDAPHQHPAFVRLEFRGAMGGGHRPCTIPLCVVVPAMRDLLHQDHAVHGVQVTQVRKTL